MILAGDVDFFAGWGDELAGPGGPVPALFGFDSGTKFARHLLGADGIVNERGEAYQGGRLTGQIHGLLMAVLDLGAGIKPPKVEPPAALPELTPMQRGRMIHTEIQNAYESLGTGWEKEVTLGKGRADLVNFQTKEIIEIKPNNPQGIYRGQRQLDRYMKELVLKHGEGWIAYLMTYE